MVSTRHVGLVAGLFAAVGIGYTVNAFAISMFGPSVLGAHLGVLLSAAPIIAGPTCVFLGLATRDVQEGALTAAVASLVGFVVMFVPAGLVFVLVEVVGVLDLTLGGQLVLPAAVVSAVVTAIVGAVGAAVGASMLG
jgi:hypothetical protein